jgi:hypothetical protein
MDDLVTTAESANEVIATETTVEAPVKEGLSNREALTQAIEKHKPEVIYKRRQNESSASEVQAKAEVTEEIEAPSGFNKQELEAWKAKDIAGIQKAFRRVHDAKTQEMGRAQASEKQAREEANREKNEANTWRELGKMAAPYIESQGLKGVTPQQAIMNALGLITAFQKADPATAKAELKALGIDLDKAPTGESSPASVPRELQEKIDSLQKWKTDTESQLEQQRFQGVLQNYETAYKNLDALRTRTGEKVFPELLDEKFCSTEEGKLFHAELGSLTKDPIFVKGVFRRFPEADFTIVCREAVIALGGKITGAPVTVPTNNQTELNKKIRASASSPGKPVLRQDTGSLKGKLGKRAAMQKAMEIHGWEN